MGNKSFEIAKENKNDEFYTQLDDIERELKHYKEHFKDKIVFCNCDDPYESNFFKYFAINFNSLKLKKLITTCYAGSPIITEQLSLFDVEGLIVKKVYEKHPYKIEITEVEDINNDGAVDLSDVEYLLKSKKNTLKLLKGDGDFRSDECIKLLKESDIIVTNPPFSLFREYIDQLISYNKKFLIIGNQNAITYKEFFPLIKENKVWLGYNSGGQTFMVPNSFEKNNTYIGSDGRKYAKFGNICWYTNLDINKRHEKLICYKKYNELEYPHYDNYNAIEVGKVADIPVDYYGIMGVPITFVTLHNPEQFRIVGITDRQDSYGFRNHKYTPSEYKNYNDLNARACLLINGKPKAMYARILIERIDENGD